MTKAAEQYPMTNNQLRVENANLEETDNDNGFFSNEISSNDKITALSFMFQNY